MVKTYSSMLPLGTSAPRFSLPDVVTQSMVSLQAIPTFRATVIFFICNHCPYVKHIQSGLIQLVNDYQSQPIRFIGINSNDAEAYPEDSPVRMREIALEHQYPFPYLFDETQEVASAYHATCTPDFFIFDTDLNLIYRGQFDDSRPGNELTVTGSAIRMVLDQVLTVQPITIDQKPSIGCNIKWKKV